jgi:hypothetical protein
MTSLVCEFQFDLPLRDATAEAIHRLDWHIEAVDPNRIISYSNRASTQHPMKTEVEPSDSGQTTDVRITGTDSDADPPRTKRNASRRKITTAGRYFKAAGNDLNKAQHQIDKASRDPNRSLNNPRGYVSRR